MFRKALIATAIIATFAVPAFAAAKTYFVEQSVKTSHCYVTTHQPNGTTMKEIGTTSYPTESKALAAMKAATECAAKKP